MDKNIWVTILKNGPSKIFQRLSFTKRQSIIECFGQYTEAYLRTCQTSMLKFFAKIVNGRKPNIKPSFSLANILVITCLVIKNTR